MYLGICQKLLAYWEGFLVEAVSNKNGKEGVGMKEKEKEGDKEEGREEGAWE